MPPPVLDYRSAADPNADRPAGVPSHVFTAAALCLATWWVKAELRYDCDYVGPLRWVEGGLSAYGLAFAAGRVLAGRLRGRDVFGLAVCGGVLLAAAAGALLMPCLNRN